MAISTRFPVKAAALGLTAMLFFASGCSEQQAETKAPYVKTQPAGQGTVSDVSTYSGTVRGRYETNMAFQVGGQILARNVQAGSRVRAGDVLMVIDSRDVEQKANQGDAQVASARAQLNLAQSNLARYTELYQADAIPAAVLDQYQTNYDAAFAAYQNALAAAAQGHNALGYTNLVAGADGVISAVNAEEGQVVAAGQNVLTLVQTGELEVEVSVPENQVGALSAGMPVDVSFWALGGAPVPGSVREISPMADAAARTYRVRVSVPNPPDGMGLGMTASVSVRGETGTAGGSILPMSAIYQSGDQPQVWVVTDDHTVELKHVTVESFDDNNVVVYGLNPRDTVVTAGVHKLREGQSVRTEAGK